MKRVFDLFSSFLGLLFLFPAFLIIAAAIRIDSAGPVFFRQERVGKDGVRFRILKFRSMSVEGEERGPRITVGGDPRVTSVGRFLRRTKMDELPQLINVWKGDMSLVGPRPEVPAYVAHYNDRQLKVLSVRPGITDIASLSYMDEEGVLVESGDPLRYYLEEVMPRKLDMNLQYIENMSFFGDMKIIIQTITGICARRLRV